VDRTVYHSQRTDHDTLYWFLYLFFGGFLQ
jgi:hypothetical protein